MNNLLTQKFPIAAFALLFVLTMSCSHDPHDENQDPSNTDVHEWEDSTLSGDAVMGSAMTFKVGGGMSVERTAQTRTTTDINGIATFTEGDLVAVAVTRSGGSEVVKLYQVKSDGSLEYAGGDNDPFVWKSAGETVSLRAWSYGTSTNLSYTLTAPETRDYTLETDQNTNGYLELLYCKAADKSYSGGTISLNFYHQLTRMVFNVSHERTGTLSVTSYSLGNTTSFPVKASFAVPTGNSNVGTWTIGSTYGTITPKVETTQSGYEKTYSAVIFPRTYAQNTKFFTITNNEGDYVFNISESGGFTPTVGNQYNYTINVKDKKDVRKNPLYYIAEYRLAENGTSFDTSAGWAVTYMRNYTNCMSLGYTYQTSQYDGYAVPTTPKKINGIAYHVPTQMEWFSIVPFDWQNNSENMFDHGKLPAGSLRDEVCTFGYNNTTKYSNRTNNTSNTGIAYKSYWGAYYGGYTITGWTSNNNDGLRYAIRFLGTEFCSVWRYKTTGTQGLKNTTSARRLEITSRLIDPISPSDLSALSSKMSEIESAPESYWTDASWGSVSRIIYWGGITHDGTGRNYTDNTNGHYISTSFKYFNLVYAGMANCSLSYGYDVLLFRDE